MICATCRKPSFRVVETRQAPEGEIVRTRACPADHRWRTVELPASAVDPVAWTRIRRALNPPARGPQDPRVPQMMADRLAGQTCQQIADRYGISLHMARYYTRLPRAKVYPAARRREQKNAS